MQALLTGFHIWAVFGRERSLLIDGGPAHLLLPIISAPGQRPPLKSHPCYQSPSLSFISFLFPCVFVLSIHLCRSSVTFPEKERDRERERTLTQSSSIYRPSSSYICAPPPPPSFIVLSLSLPRQLWSKLISRWFCEMLIDWTVSQTYRLPLSICPPHCIARKEEEGWAGHGERERRHMQGRQVGHGDEGDGLERWRKKIRLFGKFWHNIEVYQKTKRNHILRNSREGRLEVEARSLREQELLRQNSGFVISEGRLLNKWSS